MPRPAEEEMVHKRAHVLLIMLGAEGHDTVLVQLLYFLSKFDIVVTVCCSARRIEQLSELQSKGDFHSLDLRLVELANNSSTTAFVPGLEAIFQIVATRKLQFEPHREAIMENPDDRPTCLVADMALNWTEEFATEWGIPRYMMYTTAGWAAYTSLKSHLEGWKEAEDEMVNIPEYPTLPAREIPTTSLPLVNVKNVAGILINTFEELEHENADACRIYLQELAARQGSTKVPQYLPIGPMVHIPGYIKPGNVDGTLSRSNALQWLDKQTSSSVLYVAFGALVVIPPSLIFELARGLELCGLPFLWVVRTPAPTTEGSTLFPAGFLTNIEGRGYIEMGWAPQPQILFHPATGGFMSHCGWNSSLESISAGIPLLTWPVQGDQLINSKFLCEKVKVALPVHRKGCTDLVVPGEDVAIAVKSLMVDDEGKEVRKNALRLKEVARATMEEGGSSFRSLKTFTDEIFVH